jgi:hypothetical protein
MPKSDANFRPAAVEPHVIQPGENLFEIRVYAERIEFKCLVSGCYFAGSTRRELLHLDIARIKQDCRDHRQLKHSEYRGHTQYDFRIDEGAA